ncbi:hypothetical protein VB713_22965 [Anabaena cylindrica UHCC 0172]|uniref:hypothetical protein n=1 Tax=Anabaena cylindrica TaxID=1165 RepID=UPI002B22088C|nr:hypothetical protein [Anabaena cylindrica]MEA5553803.1 hypothetical protein [Anabaena cylindrica UHCC 0172]
MTSFIHKGHLDFLSENQKAELSKHFMTASTNDMMPHQLAVQLGIKRSDALAVLTILEDEGLCEMKLLIYHNCEPDVPAGAIPFGQGFPNLPWFCPLCEKSVHDYNELSYDLMAHFMQQHDFVESSHA